MKQFASGDISISINGVFPSIQHRLNLLTTLYYGLYRIELDNLCTWYLLHTLYKHN